MNARTTETMQPSNHRAQALESARHLPVEIELIPVIQADPRIRLPQHHGIVATEPFAFVGDE